MNWTNATIANKGRSNFPKDLAALLGAYWIMLPIAALSSVIFSGIRAVTGNGDLTLLWIVLGIGFVGAAVFFVARLSQSTKENESQPSHGMA